MLTKNVLVLGLDEGDREHLSTIRGAQQMRFHSLAEAEEVVGLIHYDIPGLLERVQARIRAFPERIDAIIGHYDFPVSTVLPLLRRELHHPTPSLEAVLACEHKYWSRIVQGEVVPEATPHYSVFDPFDDTALLKVGLDYPYWMKLVKAFSSYLGFKIRSSQDFTEALHRTREGIGRFQRSFHHVLAKADLPAEIATVDGGYCIAEEIISAEHQATVEGYVHRGEVVCYGIIDSVRRPGESSFLSYEYPSALPERVKSEMRRISERVMRHIGFDDGPFNIEYFWDDAADRVSLLEINPRISKSHSPLFELVEGASHHEVVVDLAMGNAPAFPAGQGRYAIAGKYFIRRYQDAIVTRVPSEDDIARLREAIPDTRVEVSARQGEALSALMDQDSYSYELAVVFIGAQSREELRENYRRAEAFLPFEFADPPGEQTA